MTRGDKSAYTDKQKRQAAHIEESERKAGRSREDAERIAWATVNQQDDAGKQSGSCRKRVAGEANRTPQRGCTSRRRPLCSGHPSSAGVP